MSNILDLLQSWKHTTRVNENISIIYIAYQGSILFTSLLSPGIIYLMIVGATDEAIKNFVKMDFGWLAFLNALPLFIFMFLCFKASSEIQVFFLLFKIRLFQNSERRTQKKKKIHTVYPKGI